MTLKEQLQQAGADIPGAVSRFAGNEGLYLKFIRKFEADPTFQEIGPALDRQDWEGALRAAHTLKGVSGNLGLTELFSCCDAMVKALRAEDYGEAAAAYAPMELAYRRILQILQNSGERDA